MTREKTSFFDLDPQGVRFVFDLNFLGALLTTQVFAKSMVKRGGKYPEYFLHERLPAP